MTKNKLEQKLIAFTKDSSDFENVKADMKSGWNLISLMKNNNYYVGIMEQSPESDTELFFIPPRKKIKISNN